MTVAFAAAAVAVCIALIITNIFIPVKYLSAYFVAAEPNESGTLRVSFLDVGYGDCTAVEFPDGKTMLIDGGDGSRANNLKILKELNARGIGEIDYLVCSSVSEERCGGLAEIMRYKEVGKVYAPYCPSTFINSSYRAFFEELEKSGKTPEICEYGEGVFDDDAGYNFCFLSPSAHTLDGGEYAEMNDNPTKANINAASAIIWIEYQGLGVLLTGNAPEKTLQKLNDYPSGLIETGGRMIDLQNCALVKIPDHGSDYGVYGDMYKLLSPEAAVLSVGGNGYGCPSDKAVFDAQQVVGENFYRTDVDGNITVTIKNAKIHVQKEKV